MWILLIQTILVVVKIHAAPPPQLDTIPLSLQVVAGGNAALSCTVRNLGTNVVYWFGPKGNILFIRTDKKVRDNRITMTRPYKPDWNIHIRNVKPSDGGVYMCTVNTSPRQTRKITLKVNVPPRVIQSLSTKELSVEEGKSATLTCNATGVPEPKFLWHVKHKDSEKKEQLIGSDSSYTIHNITRDQAGTYMCSAFNSIGSPDTHEMKVYVEFPPEITVPIPRVLQFKGKPTRLVCGVNIYPFQRENIYWQRGDFIFRFNHSDWKYRTETITLDEDTVEVGLDIYFLEPSDFGNYSCVVKNKHGEDRGIVFVEEYKPTTKAPITTMPAITTTPPTTTETVSTTMSTTELLSTTYSTTTELSETTTLTSESTLPLTSLTSPSPKATTPVVRTTTRKPLGPVIPPDPVSPPYNISTNPAIQTDPGSRGNGAFSISLAGHYLSIVTVCVVTLTQLLFCKFT